MRALVVLSLVVVAGCASAANTAGRAQDRSELTRAEIERTGHRTALELVQSERPHWLRPRGRTSFMFDTEIAVYLDGVRAGGPDFLNRLHPLDIESIRYYDAREAQYRFGLGHTQGALDVVTRR
jgi:hypothetical protein